MASPAGTIEKPSRTTWRFDGFVVAAASDRDGRWLAFGLGSGKVRLVDVAKQVAHASREIAVHDGAVLALVPYAGGFLTGGDDGALCRVDAEGAAALARFKGWVEHVAPLPDGRIAVAVGKRVHVVDAKGVEQAVLGPHPSTVAGLSVEGGRLAVCHYNGVSLYDLGAELEAAPRKLEWKGSHLAVAISPDGRYVATSTQDNDIHAWRLEDNAEMRMSGYPFKVRSLSWSADSLMLATSGADMVAAWPFDGPGPEGRAPHDFFDAEEVMVTRVACHPRHPMIAAGLEDGSLVLVDARNGQAGRSPVAKRSAVSALAWSADGRSLLAGAENGQAVILSVPSLGED